MRDRHLCLDRPHSLLIARVKHREGRPNAVVEEEIERDPRQWPPLKLPLPPWPLATQAARMFWRLVAIDGVKPTTRYKEGIALPHDQS